MGSDQVIKNAAETYHVNTFHISDNALLPEAGDSKYVLEHFAIYVHATERQSCVRAKVNNCYLQLSTIGIKLFQNMLAWQYSGNNMLGNGKTRYNYMVNMMFMWNW